MMQEGQLWIAMSDNFDVEKWKIERPMDYLAAINLIRQAQNKNEVFKWIYKITRLYIPDKLYKYYSLNDNERLNVSKLSTLRDKSVYMSDAKYLNDPFDGKAYFYNPERLLKFERLQHCQGRIIDDFTSFVKVTALTANGINSMPMWAHYANNHQGYCVAYNMTDENNLRFCAATFPIQYTDQRIDITDLMESQVEKILSEIEMKKPSGNGVILLNDLSLIYLEALFCNLKHISWKYENEFRCSVGGIIQGMPFLPAFPCEIYIGANCSDDHTKSLVEIGLEMNIPVYKMGYNEFDVEFNMKFQRLT